MDLAIYDSLVKKLKGKMGKYRGVWLRVAQVMGSVVQAPWSEGTGVMFRGPADLQTLRENLEGPALLGAREFDLEESDQRGFVVAFSREDLVVTLREHLWVFLARAREALGMEGTVLFHLAGPGLSAVPVPTPPPGVKVAFAEGPRIVLSVMTARGDEEPSQVDVAWLLV